MDPKDIDLQAAFGGDADDHGYADENREAYENSEASEVDPAAAEAMAQELSDARARLLEAPVADVVVNHAIGLYELAAIHLTAQEPDFDQTRLAIDALKAIVENLSGRLGEGEEMLTQALASLQMGFVQRLAEVEQS